MPTSGDDRKVEISATLEPIYIDGKLHYLVGSLFGSSNPCVGIDSGNAPDGTPCIAGQPAWTLDMLRGLGFSVRALGKDDGTGR